MLYTNFRENRFAGSGEDFRVVFTIYGRVGLGHLDHVTRTSQSHLFPLPMEAPHKVWLSLAKQFQRRRSLKSV